MKEYIKIIRPINLLFILLILILFRYAFVVPKFYEVYDFIPALNTFEYILLILITLLTAASGYVINDIYDSDIDTINKPNKVIIEKTISVDNAYNFYKLLCLVATILTITLAVLSKNLKLATLPIIILVALNFYAQYFKKQFFIGNFIIAIFAAFVLLLPALYESSTFNDDQIITQIQSGIFAAGLCYAIFAFLTTLLREIVKDMQDIEGDLQYGCKSVPIKLGIIKTKIINTFIILITIIYCISFALYFQNIKINYVVKFVYILLISPLVILLIINWWAKSKKQYAIYSNAIKIYMLIGICTMFYFIYTSGTGSYIFVQYLSFLNNILN